MTLLRCMVATHMLILRPTLCPTLMPHGSLTALLVTLRCRVAAPRVLTLAILCPTLVRHGIPTALLVKLRCRVAATHMLTLPATLDPTLMRHGTLRVGIALRQAALLRCA